MKMRLDVSKSWKTCFDPGFCEVNEPFISYPEITSTRKWIKIWKPKLCVLPKVNFERSSSNTGRRKATFSLRSNAIPSIPWENTGMLSSSAILASLGWTNRPYAVDELHKTACSMDNSHSVCLFCVDGIGLCDERAAVPSQALLLREPNLAGWSGLDIARRLWSCWSWSGRTDLRHLGHICISCVDLPARKNTW